MLRGIVTLAGRSILPVLAPGGPAGCQHPDDAGNQALADKCFNLCPTVVQSGEPMLNTFVQRHRSVWRFIELRRRFGLAVLIAAVILAPKPARAQASRVVVDDDGTVHVPEQAVPISSYLSPEAKAYVTQHLKDMQHPETLAQDNGVPRFLKGYLERQKILYSVDREDTKIAGVHAYVYAPKAGVAEANRSRVLINLHGGGFSGCWPACAELESIPIAALGRIRVISLDYREGPNYKFPAASEDVAAVYKEMLKNHPPESIGIYGCSAGGMLTAMSVAWFQKHNLPRPGAVGIFCAGAGSPT
jgi:epsilon-lactone hydrolase